MEANNHMDKLISKYWEGNTTLEEEKQVKAYFSSADIQAEHETFQSYFNFLKSESQIENKNDFEIPSQDTPRTSSARIFSLKGVISVAATIILLVGFFWIYQGNQVSMEEDTFENPEMAYEQAKAALFYLSDKMEKGTESTSVQLKQLEKLSIFN